MLLAVVLAVTGAGGLVVEHLHAQQRRGQQWAQVSEFNRAQLLPTSPARALLEAIADADPTVCTTLLAPAAAAQLATTVGAPDCPTAVRVLADQLIDARRYPAPDFDALPQTLAPDSHTGIADMCRMTWHGLAPSCTAPPPRARRRGHRSASSASYACSARVTESSVLLPANTPEAPLRPAPARRQEASCGSGCGVQVHHRRWYHPHQPGSLVMAELRADEEMVDAAS